ncbi:glycosyltransferase family 2 protein [Autumnicola psychrophila]|uniref:Glycosyltransferase family 2 protein n=1 Tax=Autumnicola psychrophila TaxID=3075592 RepID=A0ABU3DTP6_9FLAO|nr:glycosyltransferase family 2 protein [Zunongwangia sp. F225]MDT0687090.1 glycosyltransferase family 2 protein [Zunongwangia sp. F225]
MRAPITVLIPTYNEEELIEQAISCSGFADEVLIMDSYSTDATVKISEKHNCTILQRKFDNFSNQKNYGIARAKNDWILVLDADEYITYELRNEILSAIKNPKHEAYKMLFKNYFINRFIHHGTNGNKIKLRLFNRKFCRYEGLVHEQLLCEGSVGVLKGRILHYTYRNLWHFFQKKNQYSELQSTQLFQRKKEVGAAPLLLKPLYRFLSEYILRLGFMDGVAGLTSTSMNGYGVLSRYVKLQILNGKIKDPELKNYNQYTQELMREAKRIGSSKNPKEKIYKFYFLWNPVKAFFRQYFMKRSFLAGKEGYILSYLEGFKAYNIVLYHWLMKRNMD